LPKDFLRSITKGAGKLGEGITEGAKTIGQKGSEGAKALGQKGSELVRVNKLKFEMGKLEKEMENNMAALGRLVYLQFKDEEVSQEEIERLLASTKSLEDDIAALELEMNVKSPVCANCQEELPENVAFCPNCGAKVDGDN